MFLPSTHANASTVGVSVLWFNIAIRVGAIKLGQLNVSQRRRRR